MAIPDLSAVPFFRDLNAAERERLARTCKLRRFDRGEPLWQERCVPNDFAFLLKGAFKLVKASCSGHDTIVQVRATRCLLCGSVPYAAANYCCRSVCLEAGTEVLLVPRADFIALVDQHPSVAHGLLREMSARCSALCGRVGELSMHPVSRRIALLLLHLTDRVGSPRLDGSFWLPVPLTRQEIAELCGTTLETTSRVMAHLGREGIVRKMSCGFSIDNRSRLRDLCNSHC